MVGPVTTRPMTYIERPDGVRVPTRHVRPAVLIDLDPDAVRPGWSCSARRGSAWPRCWPGGSCWGWCGGVWRPGSRCCSWRRSAWAWLRVPVRLNPTEVVRFRYSWLDFTPVPSPTGLSGPALDWFVEGRYALGRWPIGLFAAMPAVAAARDLARRLARRGRWTEWAAVALGTGAGRRLGLGRTGDAVVALAPIRWIVFVAWLAALALPAWLVTRPRGIVGRLCRSSLRGWDATAERLRGDPVTLLSPRFTATVPASSGAGAGSRTCPGR